VTGDRDKWDLLRGLEVLPLKGDTMGGKKEEGRRHSEEWGAGVKEVRPLNVI